MNALWQQIQARLPGAGRRFVAVDFDSHRLRLVVAQRCGQSARILALHQSPLPEGMDVADALAMGEFLGRTMSQHHLGGCEILMAVPRSQAVLRPVMLPPGTESPEMPAMVQYQVEKELPFRPEEAVIDFTPASHYGEQSPQQGDGVELLVAAVRVPQVDYYRQLAIAAKSRLTHLGLRPCADLSAVAACTALGPQETVILVHLSADETEIDILFGDSLALSRSTGPKLPLGGTPEAVSAAVGQVVMEVARTVQSYQATQRGGQISAVLIAGGTGCEKSLAEHIVRRLALRCELLSPARALPLPPADGDGSAFISPLGLALSHGAGGQAVDFLAPKRPLVVRDAKKMRAKAIAAAAAILLVCGMAAASFYVASRKSRIGTLAKRLVEMQKENQAVVKPLAKRMASIENWLAGSQSWLDHLAQLSCLLGSCQETYVTSLRVDSKAKIDLTVQARNSDLFKLLNARLAQSYGVTVNNNKTSRDKYDYSHQQTLRLAIREPVDLEKLEVPPARPADDVSGEVTAAKATEAPRAPSPAPTLAGGPPPPADGYGQFDLQLLNRSNQDKLAQVADQPVRLTARMMRLQTDRYLLSQFSSGTHLCSAVLETSTGRTVYCYVPLGSPLEGEWRGAWERLKSAGTVTVWGRGWGAADSSSMRLALLVEGFQAR